MTKIFIQGTTGLAVHNVGRSRTYSTPSSKPKAVLLGATCSALLGAAFAGGLAPGVASATSPVVQTEIKALATYAKLARAEQAQKRAGGPEPGGWVRDIEWIRFETDVSVSALANLFDVTRKTFYSWMNAEGTPRSHRVIRIAALRTALATLSSREERSAVFGLLDWKSGGNQSIRELMASNSEDVNILDQLSNVLAQLAPQIQKATERSRRAGGKSRSFEADFSAA